MYTNSFPPLDEIQRPRSSTVATKVATSATKLADPTVFERVERAVSFAFKLSASRSPDRSSGEFPFFLKCRPMPRFGGVNLNFNVEHARLESSYLRLLSILYYDDSTNTDK